MPDLGLRIKSPGVVIGLAWTPFGGEILFVEAVAMRGNRGLTLTGQLGDVMKESASTALSFIRANCEKLKVDETFFENHDIHIHVPEGAIPKDGPSAGVTMLTALVSLICGKRVRPMLAMTGEITLRGRVLPIGGLKEKLLAAKRAGIHRILIPQENEKNLEDVPMTIPRTLEIIPVAHMDKVLDEAILGSFSVTSSADNTEYSLEPEKSVHH